MFWCFQVLPKFEHDSKAAQGVLIYQQLIDNNIEEKVPASPKTSEYCDCGLCSNEIGVKGAIKHWQCEDEENIGPFGGALSPLWIWRPFNFDIETYFNDIMGRKPPFCSICQNFISPHIELCNPCPPQSMPLLPELAFAVKTKTRSRCISKLPTESYLLHCSKCSLVVHAFCYGAPERSPSQPWLCDRCSVDTGNVVSFTFIRCELVIDVF